MKRIRSYFCHNIESIRGSPWLPYYGAILAFGHILTFFFWVYSADFIKVMEAKPIAVCWPLFPSCGHWILLRSFFAKPFLAIYAVISAWAIILFLRRQTLRYGYGLLFLLTLLKALAVFQDYRLMGNYNYFHFIISFVFLFLPRKCEIIPLLLVAFYFSAGFLKINYEWISGVVLLNAPIQGDLLKVACVFAIYFELYFIFGVLSKKRNLFLFSIILVLVFHLFSWTVVGFFYPCLMISLGSAFVFRYKFPEKTHKAAKSTIITIS